MIQIDLIIGKEEGNILSELAVDTPVNKRKRKIVRFILAIGIIVFLSGTIRGIRQEEIGSAVILGIACIAALIWFVFARNYQVMRMKQFYRRMLKKKEKEQSTLLKMEYLISADEICIRSDGVESKLQWKTIRTCFIMLHFYILQDVRDSYILLDQNRMTEAQRAEFEQLIAEKGFKI